jgi:hypothetical protein
MDSHVPEHGYIVATLEHVNSWGSHAR